MLFAALPFPSIDPFALRLDLGFMTFGLRWYALAYIAGLLIGWRYVARMMKRPELWPGAKAPMKPEETEILLFVMAIGVVLGGRLGYVLFYNFGFYLTNPFEIFKTWQGGMSFHGGMLGVAAALWIACRINRWPLLQIADAMACVTPIGLFFGRLANFINGELYGRPWDGPWAFKFPHWCPYGADSCPDPGAWYYLGNEVLRHPSQLYEALLEGLILFFLLRWLSHKRFALRRPGLCTGVFLLFYGAARIFVEHFREPDYFMGEDGFIARIGEWGLTQGMLLSAFMVAAGALFILYARRHAQPAR